MQSYIFITTVRDSCFNVNEDMSTKENYSTKIKI